MAFRRSVSLLPVAVPQRASDHAGKRYLPGLRR